MSALLFHPLRAPFHKVLPSLHSSAASGSGATAVIIMCQFRHHAETLLNTIHTLETHCKSRFFQWVADSSQMIISINMSFQITGARFPNGLGPSHPSLQLSFLTMA